MTQTNQLLSGRTLSRTRNLLAGGWMAFALYGFIALAHASCKLPAWTAPLLSWRFGPACTVS